MEIINVWLIYKIKIKCNFGHSGMKKHIFCDIVQRFEVWSTLICISALIQTFDILHMLIEPQKFEVLAEI